MGDLERFLEGLPSHIKVAGYRFALLLVPAAHPDINGDYGCTNFGNLHCSINVESPFQIIVNSIVHELNHAINHVYGIGDSSCEEDIANQNANGWIALRMDNARFDGWLNEAIRLLRKMQ